VSAAEHQRFSANAAAYALGALSETEAREFEEHLASCAICRDEVAACQQVANQLPMSAAQYDVPRGLRRRVFEAVRAEQAQAPGTRPGRRGRWSMFTFLSQPFVAAGVAAALGVGILIGLVISPSTTFRTHEYPAQVGYATIRISNGRAELISNNLKPPPPGDVYEVWLEHGSQAPLPTDTLFNVTSKNTCDVGLSGSFKGVTEVLVTAEPAGGTQTPTTTPVITAHV
jgi:anti-sigma-K factor RskA